MKPADTWFRPGHVFYSSVNSTRILCLLTFTFPVTSMPPSYSPELPLFWTRVYTVRATVVTLQFYK